MKIPFPMTLGHEWVGVIEEIGENPKSHESRGQPLEMEDRITIVPSTNRYCGECYFCKFILRKPTLYTNRKVMGVNMTSSEEPHLLGGWVEKIYVDAEKF